VITQLGEVFVDITAKDNKLVQSLSKAEQKTAKSAAAMSKKLAGIGKGMTIAGGVITAAFAKTFLDFTKYETKLIDMAKVTDEPFDKIQKKLKTLDPIIGNSTELMSGYYQVISAGVKDPIKALELLRIAAETGKAAHVEQSEVVKGITKMMTGYEGAIESAAEAADLLFSIEKEGQTSVAELIPVIGGLAKTSSDLNIKQEAMAASLAVISKTAGSTAEASTQYEAVLTGLMKPTENMKNALGKMGYATAEAAIEEEGLVEVLKFLEKHTGGSSQALGELFGRKEAMVGFSALSAKGFKTLNDTIVEVGKGAGGAKKAFDDWSESGQAAIDGVKNTFQNLLVNIGEIVAPMIKDILGKVTDIIKKIGEWADAHKPLVEMLVKVGATLGVMAAVGGPILLAVSAFLKMKVAITAISVAMKALSVSSGPIGLLILAVGGLYLAWEKNLFGMRDITEKVFDYITIKFEKLEEGVKRFVNVLEDTLAGGGGAVGAFGDEVGETLGKAGKTFDDFLKEVNLMGKISDILQPAEEAIQKIVDSFTPYEKKLQAINNRYDEAIEKIKTYITDEDELKIAIDKLNEGRKAEITLLDRQKTALEKAAEAKKKLADLTKSLTDKIYEFTHTEEEVKLRDINREYDLLIENAKEVFTDYNELRKAIEAINEERQKEIDGLKEGNAEKDVTMDKNKELGDSYKELKKPIEEATEATKQLGILF